MDELRELYQEVILEHYQSPRNFGQLDHPTHQGEGNNPLCGDRLTLDLQVEDDIIRDVRFQGSGCAISKASASLMTTMLKGKTVSEALHLFDQFHHLVTTGKVASEDVGKLAVLAGVHKYPSRIKCASLAWHTMKNVLQGETEAVTTE
jgi:nitrogen fixation NifU-like protein